MLTCLCRGPGPAAVRRLALSVLAVMLPQLSGCGGPPQVESQNREIVTSLATAVSARDPSWLEQNAQLVERHKAEGRLSETEYQVFRGIIAQAKAGEWDKAEQAVYALREAQRPTAEDRENVARRKLAPDHGKTPQKAKQPRRDN